MDDMNQKENAIKLSLQTMDYRMSVVEDLAVQNVEVLNQLKQIMLQFDPRSRHISASSTRSSRGHLDSEGSVSDLQHLEEIHPGSHPLEIKTKEVSHGSDVTLTPDGNTTMRSMPSPILVHSHKTVKDDTLQRFTDSPKTQTPKSKRQIDRQSSLKLRRSLPKVLERNERSPSLTRASPMKSTEESDTNLLSRRHGHLPKLRIDQRSTAIDELDTLPNDQNVFSQDTESSANNNNGNNNSSANSVYSTAQIATNMSLSTRAPAQISATDTTERKRTNDDTNLNRSNSEPLSVHIPTYASSYLSAYSGFQSQDGQPTYSVPFTPILTSLSAEYTTITDEIDTTCMINRSPPRSPTSALPYNNGETAWDEEKPENPASISEKKALRQAEEMEHRRMEKVIRKRLRQISQDESDSISDIARLVICEMEIEDNHSDHEDDEDMHGSSENVSDRSMEDKQEEKQADKTDSSLMGGITFDAIEIRIRRASTQDEDGSSPKA